MGSPLPSLDFKKSNAIWFQPVMRKLVKSALENHKVTYEAGFWKIDGNSILTKDNSKLECVHSLFQMVFHRLKYLSPSYRKKFHRVIIKLNKAQAPGSKQGKKISAINKTKEQLQLLNDLEDKLQKADQLVQSISKSLKDLDKEYIQDKVAKTKKLEDLSYIQICLHEYCQARLLAAELEKKSSLFNSAATKKARTAVQEKLQKCIESGIIFTSHELDHVLKEKESIDAKCAKLEIELKEFSEQYKLERKNLQQALFDATKQRAELKGQFQEQGKKLHQSPVKLEKRLSTSRSQKVVKRLRFDLSEDEPKSKPSGLEKTKNEELTSQTQKNSALNTSELLLERISPRKSNRQKMLSEHCSQQKNNCSSADHAEGTNARNRGTLLEYDEKAAGLIPNKKSPAFNGRFPKSSPALPQHVETPAQKDAPAVDQVARPLISHNNLHTQSNSSSRTLSKHLASEKSVNFLQANVFSKDHNSQQTASASINYSERVSQKSSPRSNCFKAIKKNCNKEIAELWEILLNNFSSAYGPHFISSFKKTKGGYQLVLNQPLRIWISSKSDEGIEDPQGGVIFLLGDADNAISFSLKRSRMTFTSGFKMFMKTPTWASFVGEFLTATTQYIEFENADKVHISGKAMFQSKRRTKTIEHLKSNWGPSAAQIVPEAIKIEKFILSKIK